MNARVLGRMNCAGGGCSERVGCRRFDDPRMVLEVVKGADGTKRPVHVWGSFDVERKRFGNCVVRVVTQERERRAA